MGRIFERELKGILSANEDVLARVTKTCEPDERAGYMRVRERPFMVVRGAGSLGIDLVAMRWGMSFPIEVKSSTSDVMRFSRSEKLIIQANEMIDDCVSVQLVPLYVFKLKRQRGDAWRVFTFDLKERGEAFKGMPKLLYSRIPKIDQSKEGNFIMRWEDGMKLSKFIDYVVSLQS
ncbi:MAG: Holliday junction resolvase [Thermoplasmata archaeon]|jgi:Holliday junction resolvase|nr:Holliday junction resolvase [Thermoplasmata archaeon]